MNRTALTIISFALFLAIGVIFYGGKDSYTAGQNVEIRDGIQYVKIDAKGGYLPKVSVAQSGIPTRLILNTEGTYDCSSVVVIKSLNYQKVLPPDGETEVDIGVGKVGETLQGLCGMGMYNFKIKYN